MKLFSSFYFSLFISLSIGMIFGSCDWSPSKGSSSVAVNLNNVYKEGYEQGFKDGRKHAESDDHSNYKGMGKLRYSEGYHLGYQQGYNTTESEQLADEQTQHITFVIEKSFGHQSYKYEFSITDGKVNWNMKGNGLEKKGSFGCNKKIPNQVITNEIKGMVMWRLAGFCLSNVGLSSSYNNDLYFRWGKEALMESANLFNQIQDFCPNSSKLPRQCLNELYSVRNDDAHAAAGVAYNISCVISSDRPETCDLAGCDL